MSMFQIFNVSAAPSVRKASGSMWSHPTRLNADTVAGPDGCRLKGAPGGVPDHIMFGKATQSGGRQRSRRSRRQHPGRRVHDPATRRPTPMAT